MTVALVVSLLSLVAACVAAGLAWSVLRLVREQHKWRQTRAQIYRDHAEFLKGLTPSRGETAIAATQAPATVDGKRG